MPDPRKKIHCAKSGSIKIKILSKKSIISGFEMKEVIKFTWTFCSYIIIIT